MCKYTLRKIGVDVTVLFLHRFLVLHQYWWSIISTINVNGFKGCWTVYRLIERARDADFSLRTQTSLSVVVLYPQDQVHPRSSWLSLLAQCWVAAFFRVGWCTQRHRTSHISFSTILKSLCNNRTHKPLTPHPQLLTHGREFSSVLKRQPCLSDCEV